MSKKSAWKEFNSADPWNKLLNITESMDDGYIIYAAENNSDFNITVTLKFSTLKNLRVSKS